MSRPSRGSSKSHPWFVGGIAIVLFWLVVSSPAHARLFVLRADATGDVPTFQAGIDSVLHQNSFDPVEPVADTLLVYPGFYQEDVSIEPDSTYDAVILSVAGPGTTRVRSVRGFTNGPDETLRPQGIEVSEITVNGSAEFGSRLSRAVFSGCVFLGNFDLGFAEGPPVHLIQDCEFLGSFHANASDLWVRRCHFVGETARFVLATENAIYVEECVFEGKSDTAAVTMSHGSEGVVFNGCTFRNVGTGIVATNKPGTLISSRGIYVNGCRFDSVERCAIEFSDLPQTSGLRIQGHVGGCSFRDCGVAVAATMGLRVSLGMSADTLIRCRQAGIDVRFADAHLDGVIIRDGNGPAALFRNTDTPSIGSPASRGALTWVQGCTFSGNGGDGLAAVCSGLGDGFTVIGNTIVGNGGAGVRLRSETETAPSKALQIENNLVAGNAGSGINVEAPYQGHVQHNDAWMNGSPAFTGLSAEDLNLELDPRLCDFTAGDFHVAASSPCAPSGLYGQIGALGVGCDVMTVPVDVQSHAINLRSNAPVEAAILGHQLFDPRRVDPSTVRLAGAAPSPRGNGGASTQIKDVNQDGISDLLLTFDSRDMRLEGGEVTIEGRTFDGVPFRGSDVVQIVGTPRVSLEAASDIATRLALTAAPTHGKLTLLLDLPRAEPATIEVFDIVGRRVASRDLSALGPGRHRIQLDTDLSAGLYLLRLRQADVAVAARALVLH